MTPDQANSDARYYAARLMLRHLHFEHGHSIRKLAKEMGLPVAKVREALEKQ